MATDTKQILLEQGMAILEASPLAKEVRIDMRQRVRKIVPGTSTGDGRGTPARGSSTPISGSPRSRAAAIESANARKYRAFSLSGPCRCTCC